MVDSPLDPTANKSVLTPTDIRMSNSGWVLGYASGRTKSYKCAQQPR